MKLLDKIALNRLLSIVTGFILAVLKIFTSKNTNTINVPKPRKKILPWRKKDE